MMRVNPTRSRLIVGSLPMLALAWAGCGAGEAGGPSDAVLYENARIIVGDGSPAIENGAFLVENGRFTSVGEAGDVDAPRGATRVDLAGKTVMPAIVNTHIHAATTREELVEQLQHYAYYGVGTVQSLGTDSTAIALQMRNEMVPGGARYLTAGRGITSPEPGRTEVPHWVTTEEEARAAVRELAAQQIKLVKIWVDDRNGQYTKLSQPLYAAVIDEAHKNNQKVAAHIFALEDAKGLLRAGIDAFAHSVRDIDIDDEGLAIFRERQANFVLIPNLPDRGVATDLSWLSGTVPPAELQEMQAAATDRPQVQERFGVQGRNLSMLNTAGTTIAMGTDGSVPHSAHLEMEDMAASGMTPAQVIVSATKNGAEFLELADVGTVAEGKSADFLVLDANPLDDIKNTRRINAVYLRGEAVDRPAVSSRILAAAAEGAPTP
jgi:imidazolonepropionase-like amidohydrolase